MISPKVFFECLNRNKINFFTGVPDSLLKDFCAFVEQNTPPQKNLIAANEGNAIALCAGYYLATGKVGLVYMQNSGLGNATNPLTSLADEKVYSIPMLLLIGWRSEPGVKDEPQHIKMGEVTPAMLDVLGIKYSILDSNSDFEVIMKNAVIHMELKKSPYAIVVRKNAFEKYELKKTQAKELEMSREDAISLIVNELGENDIVISTTGKASRELYEIRNKKKEGHNKDFLTVGSMGHSSSIALAIALQKPKRNVYCIDGDGALIMHMGALSTIGKMSPSNFMHIIINNMAHESVGGQPTAADIIDIVHIAKANGYKKVYSSSTLENLKEIIHVIKKEHGPIMLEVKVNLRSRENLGRPKESPIENKKAFMDFLK